MSTRVDILNAMATILASVSGLSADLVHRGIPDVTMMQAGPLAFIDCPNLTSREDDHLGGFRRMLMVHIVLVTPAAIGVSARDTAIDTLADLVCAALEADRTLSAVTSAPVVAMALESFDVAMGDEIAASLASQAVAEMVIRIEYIATSGMGI